MRVHTSQCVCSIMYVCGFGNSSVDLSMSILGSVMTTLVKQVMAVRSKQSHLSCDCTQFMISPHCGQACVIQSMVEVKHLFTGSSQLMP